VATGGSEKKIKGWDLESGKRLFKYSKFAKAVTHLDFSQNGEILAAASLDNSVLILKIKPSFRVLS
jgi:WD40 repeat protein